MNWLDLVILILILLPAFIGFHKGFLRKVLGILGLIGGFVLAVRFYKPVTELFNRFVNVSPSTMKVAGFLIIIAVIYIIAVWLARFASNINPSLNKIDKISGAILGLAEGTLLTSILLVNLSFINYPDTNVRRSSLFYHEVYGAAPAVLEKIIAYSPELKNLYEEYKSKLLNNNVPNTDNRR